MNSSKSHLPAYVRMASDNSVELNPREAEVSTETNQQIENPSGRPVVFHATYNSSGVDLIHLLSIDENRLKCMSSNVKIWGLIAVTILTGLILVISGAVLLGKSDRKVLSPSADMITDTIPSFETDTESLATNTVTVNMVKVTDEPINLANQTTSASIPSVSVSTHNPSIPGNLTSEVTDSSSPSSIYVTTDNPVSFGNQATSEDTNTTSQVKKDVCQSKTCQTAVKEMLAWRNTSVDPCNNFFEFACQSWQQQNYRPNYTSRWNVFQKLTEKTNAEIIAILQQNSTDGSEYPKSFQKVKEYYKSCLESNSTSSSSYNTSMDDMWDTLQSYGGWPLLYSEGTWNSSQFNWMKSVVDLKRRFRTGIILDVTSYQHPMGKVSDNRIVVKPASIFKRGYNGIFSTGNFESRDKPIHSNLSHPSIMELIVNISRELLVFNGKNHINETYLKEKASSIMKVQEKLIQITGKGTPFRQTSLQEDLTLSKLQNLVDTHLHQHGFPEHDINWTKFLTLLYSETGINITYDEPMHVSDVDYLLEVSVFISSLTPEELANFLHFHMAVELAFFVPTRMQEYVNAVKGLSESKLEKPRNITCLEIVQYSFRDDVGFAYVKSKYPDPLKALTLLNETKEMYNAIKESLLQEISLSSSRYFIPDDIEYDINSTDICVGFPDWIYDSRSTETEYGGVKIDPDDTYLKQYLSVNAWSADKELKRLRIEMEQPNITYIFPASFDKCNWYSFVGNVEAFNDLHYSVYIPLGILQAPFFDVDFPSSVKYGRLGSILGHEMTHTLRDSGWTTFRSCKLNPNADCYARQYSNFSGMMPANMSLSGTATLNENIADNVGLFQAYKVYKSVETKWGEMSLPELSEYTNDQIFFLSFAQNWCESNTWKGIRETMEYDTHSPRMFRVLGSLMNSKEFANAWKCPAGSKMNPSPVEHEKCSMF